jgi:hypothetical protein
LWPKLAVLFEKLRAVRDSRRNSLGMVANRRRSGSPSPATTATTLPARMGGATQIGSKHTFQIKLTNGLTSSRVQTTFAVHAR